MDPNTVLPSKQRAVIREAVNIIDSHYYKGVDIRDLVAEYLLLQYSNIKKCPGP